MSADGSAEARPPWWTPRLREREVLLSLAATPGPLPAAVATWLAEGRDPSSLLRAHSPEPGAVAAQLDTLGLRLLVSGDAGWPLSATPPDPPCAWLFTAGPVPPEAAASVAVVGGRRASPLRRVAARSIGAGLARAGWCVVSGGRSASTRPPTPVPWTLVAQPWSCSGAAMTFPIPAATPACSPRFGPLAARCSANTRPAASPARPTSSRATV